MPTRVITAVSADALPGNIRKMSWLCDDLVWDFTSEKRVSV
ncbi:hypothetical protein HMPREF9345_01394 [Escherichia coli MS 107-1]|nr:hypothetical protein HMPREF9345_01394 [Escherichia coli MS 107-1]